MNTFCALNYKNGIAGIGISDNRICDISYDSLTDKSIENIGDIYVAKVMDIVSNINSAFISYAPSKKGYVSLKNIENPILLNRTFDGKLKAGDEILVSLETEAIRTKDPVFTTNLSLAGKYCVISSGNRLKTVSSKINKIYKDELLSLIPDDIDFGVIIRTNAMELIQEKRLDLVKTEILNLTIELHNIISEGIHRTIYSKIYQAPGSFLTALRDNKYKYDRIVTDNKDIYNEMQKFISIYMPDELNLLSLYENENLSLNNLYSIDTKIEELLSKKVWLKSGAYLIIEQTEAMYVIDVNSGKNVSKKSNSEYVYNINLEAANEIMRQIRLRNMSGMILVDFINMASTELEEKLFYEMSQLAKLDSIKTVIVDYTKLGLLEITRKKVKNSLICQMKA